MSARSWKLKWMALFNKCLMSEDNMKMKSRLQDIIGDNSDETFDDCDQTSPILFRDCDFATQLAYLAERQNASKDDPANPGNHRS